MYRIRSNLQCPFSHIPSTFLRGSSQLLRPHQNAFVIDRIENFMRTYDLPALSIAIAKDERLKFAAGMMITVSRWILLDTCLRFWLHGSPNSRVDSARFTLPNWIRFKTDNCCICSSTSRQGSNRSRSTSVWSRRDSRYTVDI